MLAAGALRANFPSSNKAGLPSPSTRRQPIAPDLNFFFNKYM
jgi:hypothetical protein